MWCLRSSADSSWMAHSDHVLREYIAGLCLINAHPAPEPTRRDRQWEGDFQAESLTASELSDRSQLAVRRASRSFCDHLKIISKCATRTKPLLLRTLPNRVFPQPV